jgi:galactose mutarotase-like enzyme
VITLATEQLRVEVAPRRGAEIRFVGHPSGTNVLAAYDWSTPVPASRSTTYGSPDLDWLSEYRGGWQELFPNAGDSCVVEGVPLPFHGELSACEWDVVHCDAAAVTLRAGARLPLVVERRMQVLSGASTLLIEEAVTNEGSAVARFVWGHHPAFDAVPGMLIDLPPGPVHQADDLPEPVAALPAPRHTWPLLGDREVDLSTVPPERQSLSYLPDRPEGWAALRDPRTRRGIAMAWDRATFPHLWLWHEIGGQGLPWYGRARIVALEPQTAWPRDGLAAAIARGQSLSLAPGERRETWLTLSLFEASARHVIAVERDGRVHEE